MPEAPTSRSIDMARVTVLSMGHFVVDLYPPFLAALLPVIIERLGLSLTLAGLLATILLVSSSLSQPLFGVLSDRIGGRNLVLCGPMVAALGMGFIGLLPSYGVLIPFLVMGGLGVACFHPQAAVLAAHFSGSRKGLGMSVFMFGGNAGYGLGPMVILMIVLILGVERSYVSLLPAGVFAVILARYIPRGIIPQPPVQARRVTARNLRLHDSIPFILLWFTVWMRATAITGLLTFLPTFQTMRGLSLTAGAGSFSVFMICGALGSLAGGGLSDRFGRKRMIVLSLMLVLPAFYGFLHLPIDRSLFSLAILGFLFFLGESPCVVMAQEMAPRRGGIMSALIMGVAWGMAGLTLVVIGALGDAIGMAKTFGLLFYLPAIALFLALFLRESPAGSERRTT